MNDLTTTEVSRVKRDMENIIDIIETDTSNICNICLESLDIHTTERDQVPVRTRICGHSYHLACITRWVGEKSASSQCPVCRKALFTLTGNQPVESGNDFEVFEHPSNLPGNSECTTYILRFTIQSGIQTMDMPLPLEPYAGLTLVCYLPNNSEGKELIRLLHVAWDRRLLFRIGTNTKTGRKDQVIPNGFEFKVNREGGIQNYGFPDPSYMNRLKVDLKDVGVL